MVVPLYMGMAAMPNQMRMNLFLMLGTMMIFQGWGDGIRDGGDGPSRHEHRVRPHTLCIYNALGLESQLVAWGALFGFVHWIITGMGLGMMRFMHPLVRNGQMDDPGAFAMGFPRMTAMGFFMLHIAFGVSVGAFYEIFA